MRTFVVNLDKNRERMDSMHAQLSNLGISYERFPAVYGKALSPQEKKQSYCAFRAHCTLGIPLSDGQIGCALSHIGIYKKMMDEGVDVALVLEDDVVLTPDFPHVLAKVRDFVEADQPQVVLFSAWNAPVVTDQAIVEASSAACTDAYVITRPAAALIRRRNFPVVTVADRWSRWRKMDGVRIYRAYPTTAVQDNGRFGTDIDNWANAAESQRRRRRSAVDVLFWKSYRAVGLALDWLLWMALDK